MGGLLITVAGVVVCLVLGVCSAAPSDCKDAWPATSCWQYLYDCDKDFHRNRCKRSCGICDKCKDLWQAQYCWDNVDLCNESYYQKNCKKTCGLCDVCADIRNDCGSRKTQCGQTWILVGCRKTCGACEVQDTGRRESDDSITATTSTTAERRSQTNNQENPNRFGNWGDWGPWEVCSATCGKGVTSRRRRCSPVGAECHGDDTDTDDCSIEECCVPQDGTWGDWDNWSTCSSSCGGGFRTRSRKCNEPNSCGQPCQGEGYESTACNVQACPRPPAVPSIDTDPPTTTFSAGVTVTLTCSSTDLGSPPATLRWDSSRQGVTTVVNNYRIQLKIFTITAEDDELSVKCLASNKVSQIEASFVLRVDQKAVFGECRASASSSTWEVTVYCDIIKVFSSNNQYNCQLYEHKIKSSLNLSLITPGGKLQSGRCSFQTKIPRDFLERRELSRQLKYKMYFNPGATWSPQITVLIVSPKTPTLTCPADVILEGSHINCTCSTSDLGQPEGRLLLFFNDRLENTGKYGQQVIFLSRDLRREDNNARVSCLVDWARNMSADRDWTLSVMYPPEIPSLQINRGSNYTANVNNSVDFTCRVNHSNVHSLELLKVTRNGTQILKGLTTSYLYFRIQRAQCTDSGIYYCRAGNTLGQTNSTSVQLNVLCPPELVRGTSATNKQLKVTEGSEGQLAFEVTGYPAPTINGVSYHQGEGMASSKEEPVRSDLFTGKCEQNTPDLHLVTCTLSIAQATHKDNGMYNIKIRNSQGTVNVTFELIVNTQDSSGSTSSLSWTGLVIVLLILIVIGVLIVFFVRRRKAARTKTSVDKKKNSAAVIAHRNFDDAVYYNVTIADVNMPSSAATMASGTCNAHNGSAPMTSPDDNVYVNYEKQTSLKDSAESGAITTSDDSPQDDLYSVVDKTVKSSSSEDTGKPPKPAPMPKPKRLGSASRKSADDGGTSQSQNDSSVQEGGDHSHPTNEEAGSSTTQKVTGNEEGLFYTELDFSQYRPASQRSLPQKEETNYAAIEFKLQQ